MAPRRTTRAAEPAVTEETPGTAPDAAPGPEAPEVHEPALDQATAVEAAPAEVEPYDFTAHYRRVLAPWPPVGEPRVLTADALKAWRHAESHIAQASAAALAEVDRAHRDALQRVHGRLDDYLAMRSRRFPADAA